MKNLVLGMSLLFLVGCGGSNSGNGVKYDLWEYMVSNETVTKVFDRYDTDSSYKPNGRTYINAGELKETILSPNKVRWDDGEDIIILIAQSNTISVENGGSMSRYRAINSTENECTLAKHYNNFTPVSSYTFQDVIRVNCDGYTEFYAKGKGLIATYGTNEFISGSQKTTYYFISVVNNVH